MVEPTGTYVPANIARLGHHDRQARPPRQVSYKSEEKMLNEPNHNRKSDAVLIDADFSNDPLLLNDILNKFEENISE
ncbi:unnamed protein product [Schistosoma margrebowiei]|uniref:Uncharacterized protein n=1 Tax=Schistosoma margrebowiei TaxID=48269 RepID=A0A183MID5_9TREM|nr:unnamed protein product [Schistosoma margrebowiei]